MSSSACAGRACASRHTSTIRKWKLIGSSRSCSGWLFSENSKIIHLSCPALQIVTELRMGDAYKLARSFPDAAAAQFCYAVLGNNTVNYVLDRGDRRARM